MHKRSGGRRLAGTGIARLGRCLLLAAGLFAARDGHAAEAPSKLALTKAAFVLNFSKYTEWPTAAFAAADSTLDLCLFEGDSDLGRALLKIHGKPARDRVLRVRVLGRDEALTGCHIAVVDQRFASVDEPRIRELGKAPVLTVGDAPGFAQRGGMIGLTVVEARLGFEVNLEATRRAELRLSSQLLALARIVKGP